MTSIYQYLSISSTVAYWVTHSPWNTEDVGSIPGTGRHIVAWMNDFNSGVQTARRHPEVFIGLNIKPGGGWRHCSVEVNYFSH